MNTAPVLTLPHTAFIPFISADAFIPLLFYIALGFYAVFTGVFYYHWSAYAHGLRVTTATYVAYIAITVPLLLIMASAALLS